MKFLENRRARTYLFIFLAAANIVTLSALWHTLYNHESPDIPPPPDHADGHPDVMGYLCERLELDSTQAGEFEKLRREHFIKVKQLNRQSGALRRQVLEEIFKERPDTVTVKDLTHQLGVLYGKKEQYTAEHFMGLVRTCNPQQARMFKDILQRTSRRFMQDSSRDRRKYNNRYGRHRSQTGKGSIMNSQRRKRQ